jgi:hypothetical protein
VDDALLDLVLQRLNDDHVPSEVSDVLFAACGGDDEPPSCSLACAVILASLLFALDQLRHRSARVRERAKRHQSFVPIQIAESGTFSPRPPCRVMRHSVATSIRQRSGHPQPCSQWHIPGARLMGILETDRRAAP